ncbi:MAG: hypothetical protein N3A72_08370 [bacterium]|nr:hypothetical protein [bacterium]
MQKKRKHFWFCFFPIFLLVILGLYTFGFLFNSQPFIYDDNSFHYFSLYYAVTQSVPVHHRLVDWNPYWFAGIPELQFYPPGSIFLGILFYYLCLTLVPIGQIYNFILLFALFFPVITSYYFLRKSGFGYIAGFFTALYLLILLELGNASGVFYGVLVGLTNSRIALGFYPLILWFGIKNLVAKPRKRNIAGLAGLFALALVCHPYHIFLPIFGLIAMLYGFKRTKQCSLRKSLNVFGLAILLGLGLSAFWWVPLFIRHNYVSSLQIWSGQETGNQFAALLALLSSLADGKTNLFFLLLYLVSAVSLLNPNQPVRQKAILAGLVVTPLLMLGFLTFVQLILIPIFHFYFLDVVRLKDGFHFAVILTSGIGIYELIAKCRISIANFTVKLLPAQFGMRIVYPFLITLFLLIILLGIFWFSGTILWTFYDFSQGYNRIGFLPTVVKEYQLDELWKHLTEDKGKNPEGRSQNYYTSAIDAGRILFTASSLKYKTLPPQFQTHSMSLTPIYTGRQIIGGLNTPFYTVASYLFFGKKAPIVIRQEADSLDNRSLLGVPWELMEESRLFAFCRKMNITTIVTNRNEDKVIAFFNRSSTFRLVREIDEFNIYDIPSYTSSWIEYDTTRADIQVTSFSGDRITLSVQSAETDVPVLVKVAYYPCWQATLSKYQTSNSKFQITILADEIGLMRLTLPKGENYQVELTYRNTWAETLGWILTITSFIGIGLTFYFTRRKITRPKSPDLG